VTNDVLVWGGGTGGVAAALQSARSGASTLLLTPGPWLGGMLSAAGVSAPDGHELSCWQTGLWGAFLRQMEEITPEGLDQNWVSCFGFRPNQAEAVLQRWVREESKLQWWPQAELLQVSCRGDRIESISVLHAGERSEHRPAVVIDGSDLGDLLAMANAPFRWGWEAREQWKEPSAPTRLQLEHDRFHREQPIQSPTWVVMGQLADGACPEQPVVPLEPPFQSCLNPFGLERTLTYGRLPGGLVMLNWPLHGNDWHHELGRCISAQPSDSDQLAREMQAHSRRFLNNLAASSAGWIRPGVEFPGPDPSMALMPYWREGRRLVGWDVVTENDLLPLSDERPHGPLPVDAAGRCTSIAIGTYANDHHYPGEDWPLAPKSVPWGGRWTGTPFCIPFGALHGSAFSNLLAADKCISVSHMANGATRLQPLILNIGQAAGIAAAMAVKRRVAPQELPVRDVQHALIDDPQAPAAVMPIWALPSWHAGWAEAQRRALNEPADPHMLNPEVPQHAEQAPVPSHARSFQGRFTAEADDSWWLETDQGRWRLITLEPGVEQQLRRSPQGVQLSLLACENRWGPWLRVIQVAIN
jgi:hypothetical protein